MNKKKRIKNKEPKLSAKKIGNISSPDKLINDFGSRAYASKFLIA